MAWSVENLQFVLFTPPSDALDAFQVWLELFGSPPDNYQRNPDPSLRSSTAGGSHAGFMFSIQSQPGRLDLFIMGNDPHKDFPVVAADQPATKLLKEFALKLVEGRTCMRLALVATLFIDCKSLPEANKRFAELTHLAPVPTATDLTFGLNIRRQFGSDGYVINRLMRWASLVKQIMQFQVGPGGQEPLLPIEQPAVILNLDINTVVRAMPFKSATVRGIVDNLFSEHAELREGGYAALVR